MKYIIHAMEQEHKGQCGISRWVLADLPSIDKAVNYAYEACKNLMVDYSTIDKQIQKEAAAKAKKQRNSDIEEIKERLYHERSLFNIYEVDTEKFPNWQSMSKQYLQDREKFANECCKKVI